MPQHQEGCGVKKGDKKEMQRLEIISPQLLFPEPFPYNCTEHCFLLLLFLVLPDYRSFSIHWAGTGQARSYREN